jgi:hypothetical protein
MRCLAALMLCLFWVVMCIGDAHAGPSPSASVTPFNGDRYGGQARATAPARSFASGLRREVGRAVGRPRAWCGWWLGLHLGMPDRRLWVARNWAAVGSSAGGPQIGAVVVWRHHVGIITGRHGNQWVVKSGNDGRAVRERPRSVTGAIAFRLVRG